MYRIAIDDVVLNFSSRIHSHKTGWARMQRCLVADYCNAFPTEEVEGVKLLFTGERNQVEDAETWLISHDMSFDGEHYNLFGGWSADIHQSIQMFLDHPTVYSLERPMPNLRTCLEKRAAVTESNFSDAVWDEIEKKCARTVKLPLDVFMPGGPTTVVLGDSHALAHYRRARLVLRNDGLTLHRMLETGVDKMLGARTPRHLVITIGSIDIRHHLLRLEDPQGEVRRMLLTLAAQLEALHEAGRITSYQVVMPYPIEHEGRRIPGTGCYKGAPFYGSREQRVELLDFWIKTAESTFGEERIFTWPGKWYEMDPEAWANKYMEKPGSVHLSPAWHLWDYIDNQPNRKLAEEYA